jgi:hypothetical protein
MNIKSDSPSHDAPIASLGAEQEYKIGKNIIGIRTFRKIL